MGQFTQDIINKINAPQTCEEMVEYIIRDFTMGGFVPFNPPEPLRSVFRKKIEELKQIDPENFPKIEWMYNKVAGEFEPTPPLPPGAMY